VYTPMEPNRTAERQRNRQLNLAQKAIEAQKAKYAQKRREKRAATTAARIARTDFPPSPSPSTSSSSDVLVRPDPLDPLDSSAKPKQDAPIVGFHDVASPLGPELDCDDSGGEYHIAVELGLRC
jgi:hypothetical protein